MFTSASMVFARPADVFRIFKQIQRRIAKRVSAAQYATGFVLKSKTCSASTTASNSQNWENSHKFIKRQKPILAGVPEEYQP
jgi:hypothetical protein